VTVAECGEAQLFERAGCRVTKQRAEPASSLCAGQDGRRLGSALRRERAPVADESRGAAERGCRRALGILQRDILIGATRLVSDPCRWLRNISPVHAGTDGPCRSPLTARLDSRRQALSPHLIDRG
jgi:hypothetical protein